MSSATVRAILFVNDLPGVAAFYIGALDMTRVAGDQDHSVLNSAGFELIVHQIPKHIADEIVIESPPERRVWAATRLDYPVKNVAASRLLARSLGGDIDDVPPEWAEPGSHFFFGYDPEGNQFGVVEAVSTERN